VASGRGSGSGSVEEADANSAGELAWAVMPTTVW